MQLVVTTGERQRDEVSILTRRAGRMQQRVVSLGGSTVGVSILTRRAGRMQLATLDGRIKVELFQSSPGALAGCNGILWRRCIAKA